MAAKTRRTVLLIFCLWAWGRLRRDAALQLKLLKAARIYWAMAGTLLGVDRFTSASLFFD
jgi:hypothetical protein